MLDWIRTIMEALGYVGVAVLMLLENLFPPLPSELIMSLAGFTTAQGRLSFLGIVVAGIVGSSVGQLPLYYLGKRVGAERLKTWADQHGRWLTLSGKEVEQAQNWFACYGDKAVFFARLVPGVRTLISIPAGCAGMPLIPFVLHSTLGLRSVWATVLAYLGYLLGENYQQVEHYLGPVSYLALGLLLLIGIGWVVKRKQREQHRRVGSRSDGRST